MRVLTIVNITITESLAHDSPQDHFRLIYDDPPVDDRWRKGSRPDLDSNLQDSTVEVVDEHIVMGARDTCARVRQSAAYSCLLWKAHPDLIIG